MSALFSASHGVYRATWSEPEHVSIELALLHESRGELTGEITVTSTLPALSGHLHQARLNLSSTQARVTLAKVLATRTPGQGLDWPGMLEVAIIRTIRAHREGEPGLLLRDAEQPAATDGILPPLVPTRKTTILFGDGGSGKSYLALAAGLSIHTDRPLLGLDPTTNMVVALLDFEWDAWEHRERMRRLMGSAMPDLHYLRMGGVALSQQVERVNRFVGDRGIEFLIVDSVGYACDGPPEEAASALGFFNALERIGLPSLCVAHVNRAGDTERPFGSAFWSNSARATWYVTKQQEEGSRSFTVALFNRKANSGPKASPMGYELTFADDETVISKKDPLDIPEVQEKLNLRSRIIKELGSGAKSIDHLASLLEAKADSVSKAIRRDTGTFMEVTGESGSVRWGLKQ